MKTLLAVLLACALAVPALAADDEKEVDRVKESGVVLREILNIPDNIPQDLLDKANCVVVLPSVKKGAIGIGGSYGRGVMICRGGPGYNGRWGAPAMYALEGISIGFQLGGQATDFVLLVMNEGGAKSLLSSKVKLGADASAAAGPVGRTAEAATDVVLTARFSLTLAPKACSPESRSKVPRCARTAAPTRSSMDRSSARQTSFAAAK